MNDWVIRCEDVALGYGPSPVLERVTLEVRAGDCWFLVGPNGQGKTTLLKAVLGLLAPLRGSLLRNGALGGPAATGYIPQRGDLEPHVRTTVREFVSGGFAGLRRDRARREAALAATLDRTGLAPLAERGVWDLSGGQRQRALVARALVREPSLLVVDEPTTGLDASIIATVMELLQKERAERGVTILFVGHDLALARRHATHAGLVHAGRVLAGPADRVLTRANLRPAYAGLDLGGFPEDRHGL